jgi:hypothetical protein
VFARETVLVDIAEIIWACEEQLHRLDAGCLTDRAADLFLVLGMQKLRYIAWFMPWSIRQSPRAGVGVFLSRSRGQPHSCRWSTPGIQVNNSNARRDIYLHSRYQRSGFLRHNCWVNLSWENERASVSNAYANLMCLMASSSSSTHDSHSLDPYDMQPRIIWETFNPEFPTRTR